MFCSKLIKSVPDPFKLNVSCLRFSSQTSDVNYAEYERRKITRRFNNIVRHPGKAILPRLSRKASELHTLPVKPKINLWHNRNALFGQNDYEKLKTGSGMFIVEAFSTAEEYRFSELFKAFSNKSDLQEVKISDDLVGDVLAFKPNRSEQNKPSIMYIFREGTIVFWNFDANDIKNILKLLRAFEVKSYSDELIQEENEKMPFTYTESKSRIIRNTIQLIQNEDPPLSQYTFSNALALSVKLAIRESSLDYYVDSIKFISEDIRDGKKIKLTQDQVFRKTGELFNLRHHINLSSDLLDTPDFYWDRQELENLFLQTCNYFNTLKRTKVMNEKLNHCLELMDLLESHLSDKHHVRLEWMVIALIMCEVVFEFIHYFEKLTDK